MNNGTSAAPGRVDRMLICIFLLALCARLVYAVFFVGLQTIPPGDTTEFLAYADHLVAGHGYTAWGRQAFRAPGYPGFMAAVFYVFGKSYPILKILQVLISSLIPVLVCLIGFKVASRKIAVLAGVYTCFYYGLVIEPSTIMTESTFTFLFTLTVFLFLRAREKVSYGIAAGMSLALMTLTRPVGLVALPLLFAWLYLILDRKHFVRTAAIIAAVSVAAMSPWWVRNYRIYHAFVPVCLETGAVMLYVHVPPENRDLNRYKHLSEYEADHLKTRDALASIRRAGPAAFLKKGLVRLATFFYPFVPAYDITWAFMCPFWLLGMYVMLKQGNKQAYILFIHFIYFPVYFCFCATTRFKYSISQFMILFASAGFFYLYEKHRNSRKFFAALFGWALANLVVWLNAPFFRAIALKAKGL
jgi:4-amino-4-deoxy-L-arabinose transferase-like glycosyltransferase